MLKRAIGLFILFSPFTSYFAISPWLRLPVVLLLIVYVLFLIKIFLVNRIHSKFFFKVNLEDFILFLLLGALLLSTLLNIYGLNHFLAYTFTFTMYFVVLKKIIDFEKIDHFFVLKMFAISAFICGLIIIADWVLINFFSIGFRKYFVTVDNKIANMLYYKKGYFITVGGVAEEPGSMAVLMNIIFPLGILYLKLTKKYWKCLFLIVMYVLSLFFLFSVAGIMAALISIILIAFGNLIKRAQLLKIKKRTFIILILIFTGVLLFGINSVSKNIGKFKRQLTEIENKISLRDRDASASLRGETWRSALSDWYKSPLWGNGPGNGVQQNGSGYHSVYLTILADGGIISLFLFLLFILIQFRKLGRVSFSYWNYLFFAFSSSLIHFAIVGDFYHAPFWILLIVIHMVYKYEHENKRI